MSLISETGNGGENVLCIMLPCTMLRCNMPCELWFLAIALCHPPHAPCFHAPCPVQHAPCTMHHAPCTMLRCPCNMPHANCDIASTLLHGEWGHSAQSMVQGHKVHCTWAWGMAYRIIVHRSHPSCNTRFGCPSAPESAEYMLGLTAQTCHLCLTKRQEKV